MYLLMLRRLQRYSAGVIAFWVLFVVCGLLSNIFCYVRFEKHKDVDVTRRVIVFSVYVAFGVVQVVAVLHIFWFLNTKAVVTDKQIADKLYWFVYIAFLHFFSGLLGSVEAHWGTEEAVKLHRHNNNYKDTPLGTAQSENDAILLALAAGLLVVRSVNRLINATYL